MEILRPLYSIENDQGHVTGAMRGEDRTSELGESALKRRTLRPNTREARFAIPNASGRMRNRVLFPIRCSRHRR